MATKAQRHKALIFLATEGTETTEAFQTRINTDGHGFEPPRLDSCDISRGKLRAQGTQRYCFNKSSDKSESFVFKATALLETSFCVSRNALFTD
jgi:hypothetical protein